MFRPVFCGAPFLTAIGQRILDVNFLEIKVFSTQPPNCFHFLQGGQQKPGFSPASRLPCSVASGLESEDPIPLFREPLLYEGSVFSGHPVSPAQPVELFLPWLFAVAPARMTKPQGGHR